MHAPQQQPIQHMDQVALSQRLGVSCRTLERWRWIGVGPKFIKIGGRVKYRLVDIEAFEISRLCQSTADSYYFTEDKILNATANSADIRHLTAVNAGE
jgi:hypothetical protein